MKKNTILHSIIIHNNDVDLAGLKLNCDNIHLKIKENIPVTIQDELIGKASLKIIDENVFATIELKENVDKNALLLYPGINGKVNEVKDNEILSFDLHSVSLIQEKHPVIQSLKEQKDLHDAKAFVGKLVVSLQRKGWSKRRINRYLFTKYKIILE